MTTNSRHEILDVFDGNYQRLGEASHGIVHQRGFWHRTFHCWLIDQPSGSIVYQRRSASKKLYPNMLDVSVAGHCRTNETPIQALEREGMEELGITIDVTSVTPIGMRRTSFAGTDIINREFQHIFLGHLPSRIDDLEFRDGEVSAVLLLKPEEVIAVLELGIFASGEAWDGQSRGRVTVGRDEFISSVDNYDLRMPVQIEKWLAGEKNIHI